MSLQVSYPCDSQKQLEAQAAVAIAGKHTYK